MPALFAKVTFYNESNRSVTFRAFANPDPTALVRVSEQLVEAGSNFVYDTPNPPPSWALNCGFVVITVIDEAISYPSAGRSKTLAAEHARAVGGFALTEAAAIYREDASGNGALSLAAGSAVASA